MLQLGILHDRHIPPEGRFVKRPGQRRVDPITN
jgi:hypothetical protein